MTPELEATLSRLPRAPGVYLMKGKGGEIIYIGKATDLRSRVRSYFAGTDPRAFVQLLDTVLEDIDFILTSSPKEALLLENTLIKRHRPRFNFMLKDDKNYLAIRIDERHPWPRVELVRQIRSDGARYFGPYHSASKVRQMLNVLNRYFGLRTCNDRVLNNRSRPCLQYQIGRCPAPCVLPVEREAYMERVRDAGLFLGGREQDLITSIESRMFQASEELEFEVAARLRDQRQAIIDSLERQQTVQTSRVDRDIIGFWREADDLVIVVMSFREGVMNDLRSWPIKAQLHDEADLLASFVGQRYAAAHEQPPAEILLPVEIHDAEVLQEALSELRGSRVHLHTPQRGEKLRLIELANQNARAIFAELISTSAQAEQALERIGRRLGLASAPRTIECYDISNFQGAHIVASRVVFQDAQPDRARYRRIQIRSTDTQDDFAAMNEVIRRRVARAQSHPDDPLPDLIVVDGGKGQLNAAVAALREAGAPGQAIVSLAESRVVGHDSSDGTKRSAERVFVPGRKNPVVLHENSAECLLLARIRNEAHDTAIRYHRSLRRKGTLRSELDDISGLGPSRRAALLSAFGSVKALRRASLAELEAVPGFGRKTAYLVYEALHPGEVDSPGGELGEP